MNYIIYHYYKVSAHKSKFFNLFSYITHLPIYPSGTIGFFFGPLGPDPLTDIDESRARKSNKLRYYSLRYSGRRLPCPGSRRVL